MSLLQTPGPAHGSCLANTRTLFFFLHLVAEFVLPLGHFLFYADMNVIWEHRELRVLLLHRLPTVLYLVCFCFRVLF